MQGLHEGGGGHGAKRVTSDSIVPSGFIELAIPSTNLAIRRQAFSAIIYPFIIKGCALCLLSPLPHSFNYLYYIRAASATQQTFANPVRIFTSKLAS